MESPYPTRKEEAAVFKEAVERLKIKGIDAPRWFGVARQTLASWTSGRTTIPREAFIILLETDNINHRRTQERFDQIAATVERLKKQ